MFGGKLTSHKIFQRPSSSLGAFGQDLLQRHVGHPVHRLEVERAQAAGEPAKMFLFRAKL